MSVQSEMTALANQVRRLSGETGALGISAMTTALAGVTAGGGSGATIQRKTGTFTTDESGNATVDCGFQPDVVTIPVGLQTVDGLDYEQIVSIDFSSVTTDAERKECCCFAPDDTGLFVFVIKRKQIGFEISCATCNWSWKMSVIKNRSFDFVAIKFTQ